MIAGDIFHQIKMINCHQIVIKGLTNVGRTNLDGGRIVGWPDPNKPSGLNIFCATMGDTLASFDITASYFSKK